MSFPSSNHTQQFSNSHSSQAQQSTSRASRPARRGLPPISTQPPSAANSPATRHILSRNSSASSTSSVLSPTQQQQQQQRSLPGAVTSTPTSATLPQAPQSGGRRFARASQQPQSLSASPISAHSSGAPSGQLTSLVITQLNILLSTLKDDKKWDTQAEKIQKLVDAHGMDVSTTYFRRLLQSNAPLIFSSNQNAQRSAADSGSYPLLVGEMQKLTRLPSQASKIADALDTNTDGDLFKDFDLSTFMDHFRLDPTAKVTLALACKLLSKQDIKTKADAILSNNYSPFLEAIANPTAADDVSSSFLSSILFRLILDPPRQWNDEAQRHLLNSLNDRFTKLRILPTSEVSAFIGFMELIPISTALVRPLQREGPRATTTIESCKDVLARVDQISPHFVAVALAYMLLSDESYDIGVFVSAVRQHPQAQHLDWHAVVKTFDISLMRITKPQFLALYNALLPIARETDSFDIQCLWGGIWSAPNAQLSFVTAFLSCSPQELDATQIPRLRAAFFMDEFADATEEVKAYAQKAVSHPMVSMEATKFLFTVIFQSQDAYNQAQHLGIPETVINANTDIFVCAASAVEKPWAALQEMALNQLFRPFFHKTLPNYDFVLHALWKHDKSWLASKLVEAYNSDPTLLAVIFEHASQHAWTDTLLLITNEFGLDLAAYGHGQGQVDLEAWAQGHLEISPQQLAGAIVTFLRIKAEDEQSVQRDNPHQVVPLKVKTVYALLNVIHGHLSDEEIGAIQRVCLQVYPRLINYGYKFDHAIDANGENGNSLSEDADAKMQEQYKMMYSNEVDPRGMIERLQHLKESEDSADQDLFACMIHGLFDEYNCFGEYPLEALATTAVLFGGIINFGVLSSRVTLGVALFMVLDAVAEYSPDDSMYKFGLQALLHFINRLEEWPSFCNRLIAIPHLRGTEVYTKAEEVVRRQPGVDIRGDLQPELSLPNGSLEDFALESQYPPFRSIHVEAPLRPELYEEPDEETSDKVMFVLNNVSKRNIDDKFRDLEAALEERHHQWFANYLVEDLAKAQPNFQSLYLQILTMFDEKLLYAEVLRETYNSLSRILNAEATMNNAQDRTNLKNLAAWLGMLTLARDQPILHRNLSFKDLLIEAHQTQRLLIAIPFTCKVLSQAKDSKVFRPPQPWLMELVSFLVELYDFAELKLNLKFEIEVLCKDLGLDHKAVEPASIIRTLPLHHEGELLQQYPTDTMDGFGDMHLMSLSKRAPSERFSSQDVLKSLPDLGAMLNYPPSSGSISHAQLKSIFLDAAQRAITEIIAPVVERSVTIAAISTSQLVEKDFAMEADVDRMCSSAHNVVKALSGSLALVTCKEPLRMSISNNIRILASQNLREPLPEGSILMFVNDNLDTVCKLVEDAAESQSMAEIDAQIQEAVERRKRHAAEQRAIEAFNYPAVSRWAFFIPEPYRQDPGGLNPQQLAIYEDFGRQMRVPAAPHANAVPQDNTRQLQELTENYLPSIPTPAENPAIPRQGQQQQRVVPSQGQTNGYMTTEVIIGHVFEALADLQRVAHEAPEEHIGEIGPASPVREAYAQLMRMIESSPEKEQLALATVQRATLFAYTKSETRLEIEVFVEVLNHLCLISVTTARNLTIYLQSINDDKVYNGPVTVCLLKTGLLDIHHVDLQTSQAIMQKKTVAVEFLGALIDELILSEHPAALRADFVLSFGALGQWLSEDPSVEMGKDIVKKLQDVSNGAPPPSPPASDKQDQLEYVFEEWVRLQRPEVPERYMVAFIQQLQSRSLLSNQEEFASFLRVCIEMSLDCFEREALTYGSLDHAYIHVDALAKLIASLVAYQSDGEGVLSGSKTDYLKAILGLLVLVMNHHGTTRPDERFNDRIFFRLMSSLLCELAAFRVQLGDEYQDLILVFGKASLALQPRFFPLFTFSWLALISHRMFVPEVMRSADRKGWDVYLQILQVLFSFLGDLVSTQEISMHAAEFYRGVLRVLLILQHDFPEFLTENHMRLNSSVPAGLLQLQNVINCAYPSSFQELPDPFTPGLKMNRLEQIRQMPDLRGGFEDVLSDAGLDAAIDNLLKGKDIKDDDIKTVISAIDNEGQPDALVANALILQIGNTATAGSSVFSPSATPAKVIERLLHESRHEVRYQLLSAITNQVRYPNAHTHYFSTALLHLFTVSSEDLQQQVARVLVERVMSARPHPWGLLVTVLELVKNNSYNIWELGWMKAAPEVERMMLNVAHSSGLAQSPRAMT
ncbi:Not1-domain-containing protein [Aureobasidium pullulans EXF-150]|uniref:General negative regulator of transcription subunit 1 n=1 Tax=Aureobasidium pullulans EXF-150 TaxID=1043002 RepID=A0A074Y3U6_AURPU|nr:Not1-domain-containing protein [Aureobasidium pullulans EXF-150]KEQ88882.1 Not1-domain-containing protein [Aureobasidium pullulans EXF-150]